MDTINIEGKNKAKILAALWNNSRQQGMGFLDPTGLAGTVMTTEAAETLLKDNTYFDYLHGRVMKVNLATDVFKPDLYDRDNGPGAAAKAIAGI